MGEFEMILRDAQNGSQEAFERLATLYGDMTRNLCRINGVPDEDLHQELLMTLHRVIGKFSIDKFEQRRDENY